MEARRIAHAATMHPHNDCFWCRILGLEWDEKLDIFSTGLLALELFVGYVIIGSEHALQGEELDLMHLWKLQKLLGPGLITETMRLDRFLRVMFERSFLTDNRYTPT